MRTVLLGIIYASGAVSLLVAGFVLWQYGSAWREQRAIERTVMEEARMQEEALGDAIDGGADAMIRRRMRTEQMIELYNVVADDELTDEERNWILWGVDHEGITPRWLKHDTAKDWVHNVREQSLPFFHGNYTWERGIDAYAHGDRQTAYETIGHVIHLFLDTAMDDGAEEDGEAAATPIVREALDDYFDHASTAVVREGAGIIALFHRTAKQQEEDAWRAERTRENPIVSFFQALGGNTPRVLGPSPREAIVVEETPIAHAAATAPTRSLAPRETVLLRQFILRSLNTVIGRQPSPRRIVRAVKQKVVPIQSVEPPKEDPPPAPKKETVIADVSPTQDTPPLEPLPPPQLPQDIPPPSPFVKTPEPVVFCCSGGGGGGGGGGGSPTPPPTQPPTAVTDLRLQTQPFITDTVTLLWTAPSDPDTAQASLTYDLRFASTTPIIDVPSFQTATGATSVPAVGNVGNAETFSLTNLTPGTTYTIALRTSDGTNTSALSTIVTFTTLPNGDAPTKVADLAMVDEYIRYPLKLTWTAPTDPETNYANPTPQLTYQIRYAATPIVDEAGWDAATVLTTPPVPGTPGTVQEYNFTPPIANTMYSIAVRMSDGYQFGPISNIVTHRSAWFGTVTTPTTWAVTASPVFVTGTVRFEAPLTIEPGVTVKLGEFSVITLAAPLTATGTALTPITFTSVAATPANYWRSLQFATGSTGSTLAYVTIEKGGNVDGTLTGSMVDMQSGVSTIDQATVQSGLGQGMVVTFPARPTLTNLTVTNNGKNGIFYTGTLDASYTLPIAPQPVLSGTTTVASGATLTIAESTIVKMDLGALLAIDGSLNITGTSFTAVSVTSIRDDALGSDPTPSDTTPAARGDWQAIRFRSGSTGSLASVVLRYGGSQTSSTNTDAGMMKVENATVLFNDFWFAHFNYGLEVHGSASTVELRKTIFLNTEAPIDPVYSLWNNPENSGTVHYVRINPTFVGIPPAVGTYSGNASVEYITIDNLGSGAEILTGWKIHDLANNTFPFPQFPESQDFILAAGSSVIVHTGSGTNSATDLYWGRGVSVWNEGSDFATLQNSTGTIIDEVAYE